VRQTVDYDVLADALAAHLESTQGVKYEQFVAIPELGAVAVSDRSGDQHTGGITAISRFQSIWRQAVREGRADIRISASKEDVAAALETWELTEYSFTVRPFNPSVRRQGEKVHQAMVDEGIGYFRGIVRPTAGEAMHMEEDGVIWDAQGLVQAGYGQAGVKGIMPSGQEAQLKSHPLAKIKRKTSKLRSRSSLSAFILLQNYCAMNSKSLLKVL